ncbi:MAG: cysteine desulfurase family protein [Acidobacteria bacterium]|nr:cysteine desulfurase family protein [Acidobacteriota bacterium]
MGSLYLDHNATTPVEPRVVAAMMPWFERAGNAASLHELGRRGREAVETARDQVAALLGAAPPEIVFTASGTEANNAVVQTVADTHSDGHLVISAFEHPSILAAAARLEERGFAVSRVAPEPSGRVMPEAVAAQLRRDTRLVCLMLANNEIGSVQPVAEVAALAQARGARVLCDAVQAVGKIPFTVGELGVDYLTIGAHKFYGPLGAAALWIGRGVEFSPLLVGGSHERHRRAGTLNVPAIVGFGAAAALVDEELAAWSDHMLEVRDRFEAGLASIGETRVHAAAVPRLPNTSNVAFLGVDAEALMVRLDLRGFAVSTGSACSSGVVEMSETMKALGVDENEAVASLRISFGKDSTGAGVEALLTALREEVAALRELGAEGASV